MNGFRLALWTVVLVSVAAPVAAAPTISGQVVDPDGRAVAGARIIVSTALGTAAEAASDRDGRFQTPELNGGSYEIRVAFDGFQADPVSVEVVDTDVRGVIIALHVSAITESVVVSASQIGVPLSRTADTVTVISAADLEARQVETVSDALRLVPGLAVTRSGGRGAITSVFPRGGGSNYNLVLVDGIRANAFGGGYDFAHLPVADVDRIEIVSGPQSAVFGSDAIGSVVQVVTRRGGPARFTGFVEGGGYGTVREGADSSGSHGAWTWGAGAEHTRSSGFRGRTAAGESVANDDYHLSHVSGSAGYKRPGILDVVVTGNIGRDERGFPGPFGSDPLKTFSGVNRISRGINDTRQIGTRVDHSWSGRVRQRVDANYTDLSGHFESPYGPSSSGTHRFDGRIQEDMLFSAHVGASAGVESQIERATSTFITAETPDPLPIRRNVVGAFGELRYTSLDRLLVTAGFRVEHITRSTVVRGTSRPLLPEHTVDSANPKLAISYRLSPSRRPSGSSTRLHASAGTGIRPPDAFEIAFTDNPDLKPERSRSLDFGIEQQFAGGAYTISATGFSNRYDDLIVTVGASLQQVSRFRSDNVSNSSARGVELSGHARVTAGLAVHASYTFLDTEILSLDRAPGVAPAFGLVITAAGSRPYAVGDPLTRRPRHEGAVDVTYTAGRLTAFGESVVRSRMLDIEPNLGTFGGLFDAPGYIVINAGISCRLHRRIVVYGRILNLADRAYEETLGYPALRRSGVVGVRVAAGR